jgi:putative hydrolase of the HAD superfamily
VSESYSAVRVVFLDALGTLVELQPPAPRLRSVLAEHGFPISEEQAANGFAAEISYYLAHHLEGSDRERLEDLRDRCATELQRGLGVPGLDHATAREAMMASLEFVAFPDVAPALAALRERGCRLVVVSNWDCSLSGWLAGAGLDGFFEAVVSSGGTGVAKPAPGIFERALEVAGVGPDEVVHVGDSLDNDVAGARAAGLRAILVERDGAAPAGVESIRSLAELPLLL